MYLGATTAAACLAAANLSAREIAAASVRRDTNIPAQNLGSALAYFAKDRNLQLVYASREVDSLRTPGVVGAVTASEALVKLLSGTGLTYRYLDEQTITVQPLATGAGSKRSGIRGWFASIATVLGAAAASQAYAQEPTRAATETLDEVVVTAQKRQESVQSVPLAITVLPAEQLERQGVQTIADLSRMSSSLEFTSSSAPGGGAFVRGIGTVSNNLTKTPTGSVSIVLDGVVLGNTNISDIFDIERVEVLRGPQGTLFGSSVSAGVISVITKAPDPGAMSVTVNAEYASGDLGSEYRRGSLRTAVNLPLSDISALRVAFHSDSNSGLFYNPWQNSSSSERSTGMRARYLLAPSDAFTINLIADYNRAESNELPFNTYRYAPPGSALATALDACGVTASDSNFDTCSEYHNVSTQTDRGLSAQIDWSVLGDATLTSITSYRKGDAGSRGDIMAIPFSIAQSAFSASGGCGFGPNPCRPLSRILGGGISALQTQARTQYSEELRLASPSNKHLEWVAGLYYQNYKLDDASPGLVTIDFGGGPTDVAASFWATVRSEEYAGFGNLTWYLNDATRLIAGARYTHSKVSEDRIDPYSTGTTNVYSLSTSASKPSWRAGAQHDFNANTMAYATVSTGYKAPLINDDLQNGRQMYVVNPELPISYELGVKQSLLDNRLAFNAAVFYEKVKDYQGQYCSPSGTGTILCLPTSVSSVVTKGIELDVFGRPIKGLTVNLSAIYNPAEFPGGYLGSDGSDLGGKQLYYASKTKATLSAEQTVPLTERYSFVIGADYTYRSEQLQYTSSRPEFVVPATNLFNARLGIRAASNWSLYVFGRNLGDEHFTRSLSTTAFQVGGLTQTFDASSRRLVGVQLEAKL